MKTKSLIFLSALFLLFIPISGFGQTPTFGTVSDFILFTSNGALTSTGTSIVGGGAIGTNLGGITGFNPVSTQQQVQNAATTQCSIDLQTLFNEIHNTPVTQYLTAANLPLSGSYSAGIYSFNSAVTLVTTVALDAQNNPNAVFIFNVVGAFSSAAATKINLVNAAKANNVFFNVDGAISFGAGASMKGNFISLAGAIDMGAGALLEGRALTLAGAISLYENTVMTAFTSAPIVVLTQPGTAQTTGTITITAPTKTGMTYSIDGIHYTNSTGVFTLLQIGKYTVTAKSADGSISAGTTVNILPFLNLGAAACFALFSTNGIITNHGVNTLVTGDIGTQTGTINYSTGNNVGLRYVATSTTLQAATDIALLETNIKKMNCDTTIGTIFGSNQVLSPKVYCFGAALVLTGDLILDGKGNPDAIFVFKIGGAFSTSANSRVILTNSASLQNVFWQIEGATTLGVGTEFMGTLLSSGAIILSDGSLLQGRALSTAGAITLFENVNATICCYNTAPVPESPVVTVIQPNSLFSTGTISINTKNNSCACTTYSMDGLDYSNTTGVFSNIVPGTYSITAKNMAGNSLVTIVIIYPHTSWTGAIDGDWNNLLNWSPNLVPTADYNITISASQTKLVLDQHPTILAICNDLTIELGAELTIATGTQLWVKGNITNLAGESGLVIKASSTAENGTLIFNNDALHPVPATVEMYSKAYWDMTNVPGNIYKWQFFGIPISSIRAFPTFSGSFVRKFDERAIVSSKHWIQLQNDSMLTPFTGYEIVQNIPKIITFGGLLVNNDFSTTLSYSPNGVYPGQHLFVNPFTAAINISKLNFGTQTEATVYLYNTGSKKEWENSLGNNIPNNSPGQYLSIPVNLTDIGLQAEIPSMQGFLIKAMSSSVDATFGISYQSVVQKNTMPQKSSSINNNMPLDKVYTIIDVKGTRFKDRMWICSEQDCTRDFDNGWDGRKILGSYLTPQLFAMEADGNYQINAVDDINNTELGFIAGEDSSYTLTFTHSNLEKTYNRLFLQDLQNNDVVDITQSGTEYSFESPQNYTPTKRFKLITRAVLDKTEQNRMQVNLFSNNHTIYIHNLSSKSGNLLLYNLSGRIIKNLAFDANNVTVVKADLPSGGYIAKMTTEMGEMRKLLVLD